MGERPTLGTPHQGKRRPPPGALVTPPQRAKPARKSARCGVGNGSPRPHPPQPQPVGSGPRPHARKDKWSGVAERPTPDAPHPGKRRPPRAPSCGPHSAQSQLGRACCGVRDGSPRPHPPHPQPVGSGPRPHARADEWSGVGERPTPGVPHAGKRRPPPGTLVLPPQRAKPARKSARHGVGDGSPCPQPPHPQPVGSGPRQHAPKDGRSGLGERRSSDGPHPGKGCPPRAPPCRPHSVQSQLARARTVGLVTGPHGRTPCTHGQCVVGSGRSSKGRVVGGGRAPDPGHPGKRRPPPGTHMPPPQRAKPARKSAHSGVGDGSPRPRPLQSEPVGSGPRPHARKDEWSGVGECPTPGAPDPGKRRPPRALVPPPQHAKPARKSAPCGVGDGSPRPHPPHPRPVGSGPWPHAPKDEWSGLRECPTPDAPHPDKRRPPWAPSCRPHSAPSQHARARTVGLVTGPHARNPRTNSQWVVGPARTPERTSGRGWESAQFRTPRHEEPPPSTLMPPQHHANLARKSAHSGVSDGSPRPHPPHPQPVGSGPRPHARKDEWLGVGERPTPDAPHPGKRRPPRAPSCCPQNAQSQLARARAVGLVTGPHAWTPRTHSQWVGGPGRRPKGRAVGGGRAPNPGHPGTRHPPRGTLMPPPQRAKPARKSARGGVGDGSPRLHPPHPQPVGSGPRPHARTDEWSGVGERLTPDDPQPGRRRTPRAPFCRTHSAQSQLARARAVGSVTGPHARTPRTHSQWVVGPGRTPGGGGGAQHRRRRHRGRRGSRREG